MESCVKKLMAIKGGVQRKVKQTSSTTNKQQKALCKELKESLKQLEKITSSLLT